MSRQALAEPWAKASTSVRGGVLQRKCACGQHAAGGECEECKKKKQSLQRKEANDAAPVGVPPIVHEVLRSPGERLEPGVKGFMESRFGHEFSQVRVHKDVPAAASARAVDALAYTVGRNVVFGPGQYAPETLAGRTLLAHELAHVVQQRSASPGGPGDLKVETAEDLEQRADAVARSVVRNEKIAVPSKPVSAALQRWPIGGKDSSKGALYNPWLMGPTTHPQNKEFADCIGVLGEEAADYCFDQVMAEPTFGTAKTTAPVASNKIKPQNTMLGELSSEVAIFNNAQVVTEWAEKKGAGGKGVFTFTAAELFSDTATIKKMKPVPKYEFELAPALDILVDYGVVTGPDATSKYSLVMDATTGTPATETFSKSKAEVKTFTESFEKRVAKDDPLASVVSTGKISTGWSSDMTQVKAEGGAEAKLADLKAQLGEFIVILPPLGKTVRKPITRATTDSPTQVPVKGSKTVTWEIPVANQKKPVRFSDPFSKIEKVSDGTEPETVKHRKSIEVAIKKGEADLKVKGRYRTFADEVVVLLTRLRAKNTTWRAGTYVGHSWAEFSADIFLNTSFDSVAAGFWNRKVVRTFFDDLNAAAEQDDGVVGKFAWRAIYNDDPLRAEINRKYGADRVLHVPHHGPHPDKLHIHLDLMPVKLKKDEVTGYEIKNGRIRILKP